MSAVVAAWVASICAVFALLFSGYQTFMLRRSLTVPFEANLQVRQIEACAEVVRASSRFSMKKAVYDILANVRDAEAAIERAEDHGKPRTQYIQGSHFSDTFDAGFKAAATDDIALMKALSELKIYSGTETEEILESLETEMHSLAQVMFVGRPSGEEISQKFSKLDQHLSRVRTMCKDVMLGKTKVLS